MTRSTRSSPAGASAALRTVRPAAENQQSNGHRTCTYVPPFKLIQEALRIGKVDIDAEGSVSIAVPLFKTLMAHLLKKVF
jgi:hypothetical protein